MITHEEALGIILENARIVETEAIELPYCLNRVLAQDIISDINMPPFDKSAVDGFACRKGDLPGPLKVVETIAAGCIPSVEITKDCCAKIMTGAKIPAGADTVIMIEDTQELENNSIHFLSDKTSSNICLMGEDIQKGDIVLRSGITIKPWHMGVMATTGITDVNVYRKINVGIISTGDELQEPGEVLEEGKIFNSNAWQLIGSCFSANTHPIYYGIVEDNLKATTEIILNAISENDIVLLTGGVSMGDYDFVPQALKNAGFIIKFDSVAMQPGRPLTYATDGQKHCFGLPGNPVSVLVQFELSVKPLIYKLMGHDFAPSHIPLKMGKTITRKKTQRKSFYPVSLNHDHTVTAVSYHGSAHINAFSDAYGIIAMDEGVSEIREGEIVYVRPL